jgi:hypothetical protein
MELLMTTHNEWHALANKEVAALTKWHADDVKSFALDGNARAKLIVADLDALRGRLEKLITV